MAKLPTVVAYDMRRRRGLGFIAPSPDRSIAENYLYMAFGDGEGSPATRPDDVEAFDQSLTLYAEHSFNASTFTGRVIAFEPNPRLARLVNCRRQKQRQIPYGKQHRKMADG